VTAGSNRDDLTARVVRVLFLLPSPTQPGLTDAERVALTLRRDATITRRCVCGATAALPRVRPGEVAHYWMAHEPDCPAADGPHLERLVRRLGANLKYEPIVVEMEVAA
jgi:hypothetical protein